MLLLQDFRRYWSIDLTLQFSKTFHCYTSISPNIQNSRCWKGSKDDEIILTFCFLPFKEKKKKVFFHNFNNSESYLEFYWQNIDSGNSYPTKLPLTLLIDFFIMNFSVWLCNWITEFLFHFYYRSHSNFLNNLQSIAFNRLPISKYEIVTLIFDYQQERKTEGCTFFSEFDICSLQEKIKD